ncbi:MAG: hypothetical protein IPN83_05990 [Holophagales bacterium]|nr:hypothetical protein [Holophagales bacterium]
MKRRDLVLYLALTWLVWGSHAFARTLYHDDAQVLFRVFSDPGGTVRGAFTQFASTPTRSLLGVSSAIGLRTGVPRQTLQAFYGLAWLGTACLAHLLARRLFGGGLAPLVAGALTATATSDFLTDSLVALPALCALLACFAGFWCVLRWLDGGGGWWLLLACALVQVSLFTTEYAAPAVALAPALLWLARDRVWDRRLTVGVSCWWLASVPAAVLLLRFLGDGSGYAAVAIRSASPLERAGAAASLFGYNFTPWVWAFGRPQWFAAPSAALPAWLGPAFAALGGGWFAVLVWREARRTPAPAGRPHLLWPSIGCLLMAAAACAPFASVHFSEVYFRTHLHSRVWASLALAGLVEAGMTHARGPVRRLLVLAVPVAFTVLGVFGGVERQGYYLGYSQRHRQELTSILKAVPRLAPGAALILEIPRHEKLVATGIPYLARAWLTLIYEDPSIECRVALDTPDPGASCQEVPAGFLCRGEFSPRCVPAGLPREQFFSSDRVVRLVYDAASNTYAHAGVVPGPSLVVPGEVSRLGRNLLGDAD